jgi:hypothetical protein
MNWAHDGQRWTLSAAPQYAVWRRGPGEYAMFIGGFEVDSASTDAQARGILETRYEYAAHAAELELARLRLRQAHERLESRYPRAASDAQLSSILAGLGDALGTGPEANDPDAGVSRATDIFRRQLTPELWMAVDASLNVVLEVTTPAGRVVKRALLPGGDVLADTLQDMRAVAKDREAESDARRLAGREKCRAEGKLTRREAVDWLAGRGVGQHRAYAITGELASDECGLTNADGMTYADGYWRVPVATEQPAR